MKVYSDTLTINDLKQAAPQGVSVDAQKIPRARKRANGYNVYLRCWGSNRHTNSGKHGADERGAASYDQHGEWMQPLFDKDPQAVISFWDGREAFMTGTEEKYAQ